MNDMLLANQILPEGWINLAVGEPHVVRDTLIKTFDLNSTLFTFFPTQETCEYPPSSGCKELVTILEKKHNAPVIITNGAKQALGATFYALNAMGKTKLGMRNPYWALIPPLAKMHGLECTDKYDCYLAILPNNPDGFMHDDKYVQYLDGYTNYLNMPFIHDAAYYTHTYLPDEYELGPLGDVQIYSISKMYGLSGLRLGYAVCHNTTYYKYIQEYMETMTVGVSTVSQGVLCELLREQELHPELTRAFEIDSRNALYKAKWLAKTIRRDVLEIPDNIEQSIGMFGWFKIGPKCDFKKAKLHVVDGGLFGDSSMVRINLALQEDVLLEVIKRLNAV